MVREAQKGIIHSQLIPHCPLCGGPMDVSMAAGEPHLEAPASQARYKDFLQTYRGKNLVILELGIGWRNQLIKAPLMRLTEEEPKAAYITINLGEVYIPDSIRSKSFSLDGYLEEQLRIVKNACNYTPSDNI